jgi:antitoxin VapB
MGMSIKNEEVERLARELADRRGVSMTEAIRQALKSEVAREQSRAKPVDEARRARIDAIVESARKLPVMSDMTEDEILGYDEIGAPTR